jgi:hypothetical protein
MADVGDSEGAIEILTGLLDQAPDAFTFRFRAELRILRQDFEGAKSGKTNTSQSKLLLRCSGFNVYVSS